MSGFTIKPPKGSIKRRRILGRGQGSGRGGTSGKGHKGQNARAGGGVRPGFEGGQMPLFRRIARRGFSNYPFKEVYTVVNVQDLEKVFDNSDTVNRESLVEKGLIKKKDLLIKLLGNGDLTKKLTVDLLKVSKSAREKIVKAGGEVKTAETEAKPKAKKAETKAKKTETGAKKVKEKTNKEKKKSE